MAARKALITNYKGLGDGVLLLPILKRLEEIVGDFYYFYTYNSIFEIPEFVNAVGLKNLLGFVPSIWRRFDRTDWNAITEFIQQNQVDTIINLRDRDSSLDLGYLEFKQAQSLPFEFWGHYEVLQGRSSTQHVIHDALDVFLLHGLDLRNYNQHWLRDYFGFIGKPQLKNRKIGFFTAASRPTKRWPASSWIALGEMLLESTYDTIDVYAGVSEDEKRLAEEVVENLQDKFSNTHCTSVVDRPLPQLAEHFNSLKLLVSNDTVAVHLAAALNIPTVSLYFCTDSDRWGGLGKSFTPIQSQTGLQCPLMRKSLGSCLEFDHDCTPSCIEGFIADISPEKVLVAIQLTLSGCV